MPVIALDSDQRFRTFLKQRVGRFQKDRRSTRFYFAPLTATIDPIAKAAGLDPTEIDALTTPLISLCLRETLGGQVKTGHSTTLQNRPFPVSGIEAD